MICPQRSQNIESSLLAAPYRTFLSSQGGHDNHDNHDNEGANQGRSDLNLTLYCLPTSLCEYIGFHEEASSVRSLLLQNKQVVAIYDPHSDTILGGTPDDVMSALTGDTLTKSALAAAALQALAVLDQQMAQHLSQQNHAVNTVIVVGSGGREHAIAVALAKSPLVDAVICCPGNGGTQQEGGKITNQGANQDNDTVIRLVKETSASMVVVGPEGPLVDGLVDELALQCPAVRAFGPTQAAAQLEASKVSVRHYSLCSTIQK